MTWDKIQMFRQEYKTSERPTYEYIHYFNTYIEGLYNMHTGNICYNYSQKGKDTLCRLYGYSVLHFI